MSNFYPSVGQRVKHDTLAYGTVVETPAQHIAAGQRMVHWDDDTETVVHRGELSPITTVAAALEDLKRHPITEAQLLAEALKIEGVE